MKAIITGVTGQDGSFLAELLLEKGYEVWGFYRRSSSPNFSRLANVLDNENFHLLEADITDSGCVTRAIRDIQPDEYYNLAAQSHVHTSFEQPSYTFSVNFNGVLNALEAIRTEKPDVKFYQASTSEMFGSNKGKPILAADARTPLIVGYQQNEYTPFAPQSPYAIAKLAAHHLVRNYRDSYGIFACSGILFNHESERRGENFVTRKITKWIGGFVASGKDPHYPKLHLGNLNASRDWGYAKDYVKAMWQMMMVEKPDDYIIATNETFTIREFLDAAFEIIGIQDWSDLVVVDPKFYRPAEVEYLRGDYSKAYETFGWIPETPIYRLIKVMVEHDVEEARLQRPSLQAI